MVHASTGSKNPINHSLVRKMRTLRGGWYRQHRRSRIVRDIKYLPVRKMRTLRRWLIPPASYVAPLARHQIPPVRKMRTLRLWLVPPASYVAPLARHQISPRAQNAHATSVVDTASIVRRALCATSNIAPCAKCARYVGG
ncbi:hypothetical protein OS145_11596 [Idiomarina baltica OS145]|uniref:Uncharacterized protein n=1 Tax=Idiomarina baltica OS145 TaxID=314276 RepID=A0ABP2CS13_9GAMM|nr:hypothetical protein OS145_11596 [Idiomarina baltica OS145]